MTGQKTIRAYKHEDADRANGGTPVEVAVEGDHVIVRTNQDRASDVASIADDLEITVPRGLAVEARGRRNDYEVSDIAGNVELASDRGDARLARVGGNVRLVLSHSDTLRAEDVKGNVDINGEGSGLELENIGGQVTVTGAFSGSLDFKNLAKPFQFEGARNTELHAQAVPGHITMDLSQFDGRGLTGPVRLVARSRDIKIADFYPIARTGVCTRGRGDRNRAARLPPSTCAPIAATSISVFPRKPPSTWRRPPSRATPPTNSASPFSRTRMAGGPR